MRIRKLREGVKSDTYDMLLSYIREVCQILESNPFIEVGGVQDIGNDEDFGLITTINYKLSSYLFLSIRLGVYSDGWEIYIDNDDDCELYVDVDNRYTNSKAYNFDMSGSIIAEMDDLSPSDVAEDIVSLFEKNLRARLG